MDLVLPGDGFAIFRRNGPEVYTIDVLGPLALGDVVRRVDLHWSTEGAGVWSFAGSLSPSQAATEENLDAGLPLIQRSDFFAHQFTDGIPAITILGAAGQAGRMALYPGLRVAAASSWIIVETASQTVGVTASVLVSIEVWRRVRQKGSESQGA